MSIYELFKCFSLSTIKANRKMSEPVDLAKSKKILLDVNVKTPEEIERDAVEIRIQMPYGFVAGKWWGPKNIQPILAIHGHQDNAGSFDRLIPLMPKHIAVLAIDLPGHGLSKKIPNGVNYNFLDNLLLIISIIKEYKWKKVTLLAHSMGAVMSFIFASVFPDFVESVIAIDSLKPHVFDAGATLEVLRDNVYKFLVADERNQLNSEPPLYDFDTLVEKQFTGSRESVTRECCPYLLKRAIKESNKHPENYYFARDSRLKFNISVYLPQDVVIEMAKRIADSGIPYLYIKADQFKFLESQKDYKIIFDIMKTNPNFEWHSVSGTHHVHLTDPTKISHMIEDFLVRCRSKAKL